MVINRNKEMIHWDIFEPILERICRVMDTKIHCPKKKGGDLESGEAVFWFDQVI